MSQIFVSHSNLDDFEALAVGEWLRENGWDDVFFDLGPVQDRPGERWESALRENALHCEAVVFLVSRNWLNSEQRRSEYELARKLNKRLCVALIEKLTIDDLPLYLKGASETVLLAPGEDRRLFRVSPPGAQEEREVAFSSEALDRLKTWLTQTSIDPRSFAWPPKDEPDRAPYRGFEAMEAKDAGIYFGRDEALIEALDALRGLGEAPPPRLFTILGASGVGKSSFLRAGLWSRLARDEGRFLPLPIIRPEYAAVSGANGLVAAISDAAESRGLGTTRAQIREAVAGGAEALRPLLRDLAAKAAPGAKPPTLVFCVDQAEALFDAEATEESQSLLSLLRSLAMADDPDTIVILATRSEFYERLERARPLEGLRRRIFWLPPLPRSAYSRVIEGPLERLPQAGRKVEIDAALTQILPEDIEKAGGDGLPLLSFALDQLYRVHGAEEGLTKADYVRFGALSGSIDAALGRALVAADADPHIPENHEARLALLRRGFIPWLAGVDPTTRTARKRVARAAQIPQDALPLLDLLVQQGLLTRRVDAERGETTLEPAHEALLRKWGLLKRWLDEDFGRLAVLESVKRASREWDANNRQPGWAAHGGSRLEEAERLYARPDFTALLDATDRAYLAACMKKEKTACEAEEAQRHAEVRLQHEYREKNFARAPNGWRGVGISVAGVAAALALAALAWSQWQAGTKDHAQKALAPSFDLAQKVRQIAGASISLMADILTSAPKPQKSSPAGGAPGPELRRNESVALNQTVDARLAQGDVQGALTAAQQSVALMEALVVSNPEDADWRRDLSVSYEKIGDVQKAQGDMSAALKSYRSDLAIADTLSTADPKNAQLRWDLSVSYEKVGDVQKAQGDLAGALKSYREDLAIREALSASNPDNAGWRRDLGVSNERIGATLAQQNEIEGAIAAFERALAIYLEITRAHPDDSQSLTYSIAPHWRLAELDKPKAREHLEAALAILEPLAATDRLDVKRRGWITAIKAQLVALAPAAPTPTVEPAVRHD
jgi:tetratricopeptide (TPR) repeat protein